MNLIPGDTDPTVIQIRHMLALMRLAFSGDDEALTALLADPELDQAGVVRQFSNLVREMLLAAGNPNPDGWVDGMLRIASLAEVDLDAVARLAEGHDR